MSLRRHSPYFAETQHLDKSLYLTRAIFYFLTGIFSPLTNEVGFFSILQMSGYVKKRCGCSGKICQHPSLRQKLLVWGAAAVCAPLGGRTSLCWVTPEGTSGPQSCSPLGRTAAVWCLHLNGTFRRGSSGTLRCVYTCASVSLHI